MPTHTEYDPLRWILAPICALFLLTFVSGCADNAEIDCGTGEVASAEGDQYCLYSSELIIEGFSCPQDLQANEVPGGVVCGPANTPLPGELEMPFPCNGEAWCIDEPNNMTFNNTSSNNQTNPINNQTTNNATTPNNQAMNNATTPFPDMIPTPTTPVLHDRIAVHGASACAYSEQGARCWGDNTDGRLEVPAEYTGFSHLTLGAGAGCGVVVSSRTAMDCWGDVGSTLVVPAPIAREIHVARGGVGCWIAEGTGTLGCFDESSPDIGITPILSMESSIGIFSATDFASIDLRATNVGGRISTVCGVTSQGSLLCDSNGATFEEPGSYVELYHNGTQRVCARSSDKSVDCWDLLGFDRLTSPPGKYDALYSTSCGLRDDGQVVCWGALGLQENGGMVETEVLFDRRPLAFGIDPSGAGSERSWCAIETDGAVTCSF